MYRRVKVQQLLEGFLGTRGLLAATLDDLRLQLGDPDNVK